MVVVEDFPGPAQVKAIAARLAPGKNRQPVEIGADDRVLGRAGVHAGQPLELALCLVQNILRRTRRLDPLPELGDLGIIGLAFPQFLLNGLDLLPQEVIALGLRQLRADLLLNLGRKLQDGKLARQILSQPLEPGPHVDLAQQNLALLDREGQARGQQVNQPPWLSGVHGRDLKLLRNLLALIDHPLEEPIDMMDQGVKLNPFLQLLFQWLDLTNQIGLGLNHLDQPRPGLTLTHNPSRTVRKLEHLEHGPDTNCRIEVSHPRLVDLRMQLADQPDQPLPDQDVIHQSNPAGTVDHQRHDRLWKHDIRAQRKKRQAVGVFGRGISRTLQGQGVARLLRRPTGAASS